jgi:predicted Co/Zn/Cd cation transporter (cation efflux family)
MIMKEYEKYFKLGMITVMTAVKKTLLMYPKGMDQQQVSDMLDELDQQLGIKETEMQLLKRA